MELDKKIIGNRIKKERINTGLTQEELAIKLGLNNKSSISQYEKGAAIPSDDIKIAMCKLFKCSMDFLMGLTSYKNPKKDLERELKKLNLTEYEFNQMISLLLDENNNELNNVLKSDTKLALACDKCLELIEDYKIIENNTIYNDNIDRLRNIIISLDKNEIINNYDKDEQEFRFAYHKDMEGLTDEEISDALRFYKEMKKRVENDKK